MDSLRYPIPDGAFYTRDDIILEILRQQLPDGGFALSGGNADPDITAMALQALAPYRNSEKTYTYTLKKSGEQVTKTVRRVLEESLDCLSALQLDTGDFSSWGTENVESTDQVTVALCCLGIEPLTDPRFTGCRTADSCIPLSTIRITLPQARIAPTPWRGSRRSVPWLHCGGRRTECAHCTISARSRAMHCARA